MVQGPDRRPSALHHPVVGGADPERHEHARVLSARWRRLPAHRREVAPACYKPSTGALYLAGAKAGAKKSTRAGCRTHFASANGEFALDVSNTGIKLSAPHASIELSNVGMTLKGIGLTQINASVLQLNAVPTIIGSCGSPDHAVRAGDVALVVGPLGTPVLTPPGSNQLLVC